LIWSCLLLFWGHHAIIEPPLPASDPAATKNVPPLGATPETVRTVLQYLSENGLIMSKKTIAAVSAPASSSSPSSSAPVTISTNNNNSLLDVPALIAPMQALHDSCANHSYEWRVTQLKQLRALLVEHWDALAAALRADLGKCTVEAVCMELIMVRSDLDYTIRNLKTWMKPQNVASPMVCLPAFTRLEQRPLLGPAVLIIGTHPPTQFFSLVACMTTPDM